MPKFRPHRCRQGILTVRSALKSLAQAVCLAGLLGAAALQAAPDRLVDQRSGRDTGLDALLAELRTADIVLLGELHDNPLHHARRATLLAALRGSPAVVVAEQLPQGGRLLTGDAPLLERLTNAGFDPKGWQWPLHEPLFAALEDAGLPLMGGNLRPGQARQVAREGVVGLPGALLPLLRAAPLPAAAEAALDDDLLAGHCGQMPPQMLMPMRLAQRARDAAMWRALSASGGRPAVLLAGNGHVRLDYGVPQLATVVAPQLKVLSVGFGELGQEAKGPYHVLWLTDPATRGDPCEGLKMPAAGASAPAQ